MFDVMMSAEDRWRKHFGRLCESVGVKTLDYGEFRAVQPTTIVRRGESQDITDERKGELEALGEAVGEMCKEVGVDTFCFAMGVGREDGMNVMTRIHGDKEFILGLSQALMRAVKESEGKE